MKSTLYIVIGALVGSLLTLLMLGIRQGNSAPSVTNTIDKHFIEQMIPYHEGAIEMAKLAQERSQRPEILTLAEAIIKSQSQEIAQMRFWLEE